MEMIDWSHGFSWHLNSLFFHPHFLRVEIRTLDKSKGLDRGLLLLLLCTHSYIESFQL